MSSVLPTEQEREKILRGFKVKALPCPFCGTPPSIVFRSYFMGYRWHTVEVTCGRCDVTMREGTETWNQKRGRVSIAKKAVANLRARWNRREGTR